jgi:hypothetical protein
MGGKVVQFFEFRAERDSGAWDVGVLSMFVVEQKCDASHPLRYIIQSRGFEQVRLGVPSMVWYRLESNGQCKIRSGM